MPDSSKVIVCGTDWCGDTRATLARLDALGVPYAYVDIEQDAKAEQWVKDQNDGKLKRPTVDIDVLILSEPDEAALTDALRARGLVR